MLKITWVQRRAIRNKHYDLQISKSAYDEYRKKFDDARGSDK